jgi:hypothetical protein
MSFIGGFRCLAEDNNSRSDGEACHPEEYSFASRRSFVRAPNLISLPLNLAGDVVRLEECHGSGHPSLSAPNLMQSKRSYRFSAREGPVDFPKPFQRNQSGHLSRTKNVIYVPSLLPVSRLKPNYTFASNT